jgi:hypothetical protein
MERPMVRQKLLAGEFIPEKAEAIRQAAAWAVTRTQRKRVLEHNHRWAQEVAPHITRTYIFELANGFTCDMDYRDVEVLFSSDCAGEFRDLDSLFDAGEPFVHDERTMPATEMELLISKEDVRANDPTIRKGDVVAITGSRPAPRPEPPTADDAERHRLSAFNRRG